MLMVTLMEVLFNEDFFYIDNLYLQHLIEHIPVSS